MAIQKLSFASVFVVAEANTVLAIAELNTKWTALTQPEKDSWLAVTTYGTDDLDGKYMFMGFFIGSFLPDYSLVTAYATTTIAAGTDGLYINRATRTWTAA